MLVLSADRKEWIELELKLPHKAQVSGIVYRDGELYLIGGGNKSKDLHKLDSALKWKPLTDMNMVRKYIASSCFEWKGDIWVCGGQAKDSEGFLNTVEKYDIMENIWMNMR